VQVREIEGVDKIPKAKKLLVRVIGGHTKKLHMIRDNGDRLENNSAGPEIIWVHGQDQGRGGRIENIKHEQKGFRPGGEQPIYSLKPFDG
jgi:hypothetical protein